MHKVNCALVKKEVTGKINLDKIFLKFGDLKISCVLMLLCLHSDSLVDFQRQQALSL